MSRSLVSIDLIASDITDDFSDSTGKRKFSVTKHIVRGYARLHRLLLGEKTTVSIILPFDNAINLPCDFQTLSKVGVRRPGYPCIAILTASNDVNREVLSDTQCCDYLNSAWAGTAGYPSYPFFNAYGGNGYYYGELYGTGRTIVNNGTYYIDKAEGILYIGSNIPPDSEVVIEYISNGVTQGLKVVPMEMQECLEYWAKFKYYADKNPALSQTNLALFKKEYNSLKSYYQHKTPYQIATAINEVISPTNY